MRIFGCVFKIQPNGFKLHLLPRQALISVSLAAADCTRPPAAGPGWECGGCRALEWPRRPPQLRVQPLQPRERKSGAGRCWAWGDTAVRGCRGRVLVTLLQPFLPEKRRWERRGHICVMQGMILRVLVHTATFIAG